ncbi:unnamed protein product [Mytilus coruscus]|uniref:Uncharacterized protein n=1 Tax=Mytilus coruscus TaxID=42192 RepID=A0A6J8CIQ0_MYTCO|nr:unnamed protein product [Mytilus coruscus]
MSIASFTIQFEKQNILQKWGKRFVCHRGPLNVLTQQRKGYGPQHSVASQHRLVLVRRGYLPKVQQRHGPTQMGSRSSNVVGQHTSTPISAQMTPEIRSEVIQTVNALINSPATVTSPDSVNERLQWNTGITQSSNILPVINVNDNLGLNVSQQTQDKIINGENVDLGILLTNSSTEQLNSLTLDTNGQLVIQTEPSKQITDINTWIDAFLIYISIYVGVHLEDTQNILKYMYSVKLGSSRPIRLDVTTTCISLVLYKYLCQNKEGSEEYVRTIRMLINLRDNLTTNDLNVVITGGSFGEGLDLYGGDIDIVQAQTYIEVSEFAFDFCKTYFKMETESEYPGYTMLLLIFTTNSNAFQHCKKLNGKYYFSNVLFKQVFLYSKTGVNIIHGPCLSTEDGDYDYAHALHSKLWISAAENWITRSKNLWPSYEVKQSIKAQTIRLTGVYGNTNCYLKYKSCQYDLMQNIYHDAASGWLLIASLFYRTHQYNRAIDIISNYVNCKLYPKSEMLLTFIQLCSVKSFQKRLLPLLKIERCDFVRFQSKSTLIPQELQMEVEDMSHHFPATVYIHLLRFLCHYHLNNHLERHDSLRDLQKTIKKSDRIETPMAKAISYICLGIALQLDGDKDSARNAFQQAYKFDSFRAKEVAPKRLTMLKLFYQ